MTTGTKRGTPTLPHTELRGKQGGVPQKGLGDTPQAPDFARRRVPCPVPCHTSVCFAAANSPQSSTSINSLLGVTLLLSGGDTWWVRCAGAARGITRSLTHQCSPGSCRVPMVPHWAPGILPDTVNWLEDGCWSPAVGRWAGQCVCVMSVCGRGQRSASILKLVFYKFCTQNQKKGVDHFSPRLRFL